LASPLGSSRIPFWLKRRGKNQTDLADHLEVSNGYISRVCNNLDELSVYNLRKTAKFLHVKMDQLIEWEGELNDPVKDHE
jgi:transcriptional regulator with XRE-family HTH domain